MRVDMPVVSGRSPRLEAENSSSGDGAAADVSIPCVIGCVSGLQTWHFMENTIPFGGILGVWSLESLREFPHLQRTLPAYSIPPHKPPFWQSILSAKAGSLQSDIHCLHEWAEFAQKLQESSGAENVIGFLLLDVTRPGMGGIGKPYDEGEYDKPGSYNHSGRRCHSTTSRIAAASKTATIVMEGPGVLLA